jgi:hypothetical protein
MWRCRTGSVVGVVQKNKQFYIGTVALSGVECLISKPYETKEIAEKHLHNKTWEESGNEVRCTPARIIGDCSLTEDSTAHLASYVGASTAKFNKELWEEENECAE